MADHAAAAAHMVTARSEPPKARVGVRSHANPAIPLVWWLMGLVFVSLAIAAAGALVYKHFTHAQLPGCHAGSACDQLETHILGRIRFPDGLARSLGFGTWPTSFLGLTYFAAIGAAWLVAARRIAPGLRRMVQLGAVVSVVYMVVIVAAGKYCKYCMASHAGNFGLLACMEIGLMMAKRSASGLTTGGGVLPAARRGLASLAAFAVAFAGVSGWLVSQKLAVARVAASESAASQEAMQKKAEEDRKRAEQQQQADAQYDFGPKGFTGRYRMGPEKSPVRIVLFGAYTCQFCRQMEQQAIALVNQYPGQVSFSFKHYPMNSGCNPHIEKGKDPEEHRNACWAARCAEACAIWAGANAALSGEDQWTASNDAFWKAHNWLYSILGAFKDDSLVAGLKELKFDADKVTELMTKPGPNNNVVKDLEEGHALGLFQTPMIFINGVELKGWQNPGELQKAVAGLINAKAPALDATNDHPPLARVKAIEDWRGEKLVTFGPDKSVRSLGKADAPAQVVVFGDFQEENTRKVDKIMRGWLTGPGGLAQGDAQAKPIHYVFRNFPGDKSCNEKLYKTFFEFGCLAARAAEAAGTVGGETAYWKMHDWLVNNPTPMGLDQIKKGARAIGIDADAVVSAMNGKDIAEAIKSDVDAANAANVTQIPAIYINGKFVKTWIREDKNDNVLERIVDEVAAGGKK